MIYLRSIRKINDGPVDQYPHNTLMIQKLDTFAFQKPITIFCGDNGCGKSTLMELIAKKLGAYRIGQALKENSKAEALGEVLDDFETSTNRCAKKNFFFTGEDFIKYIEWVELTKIEARENIADIDEEYGDTYAGMLAKQPHSRTLYDLSNMYGNNLSKCSHGEGFIDFFRSRIISGGLYLLDEPESALSYENQYLLAILIREAVNDNCQFIISTHSPIITALPEADIFEIQSGELVHTTYEALENIQFLQMFFRKRDYLFEGGSNG